MKKARRVAASVKKEKPKTQFIYPDPHYILTYPFVLIHSSKMPET